MPTGYREMVEGLWLLDRLQFNEALTKLCHPEVSSHFADKIINAYMKLSKGDNRAQQTVAYINSTTPSLISPETLDLYVEMLCSTNLYCALEFARSASEDAKVGILSSIVHYCLSNATSGSNKRDIWRLANLPLTHEESQLVDNDILLPIINSSSNSSPEEASYARDVLMMRSLHTGDLTMANKVATLGATQTSSSSTGNSSKKEESKKEVAWSDISRGLSLATM